MILALVPKVEPKLEPGDAHNSVRAFESIRLVGRVRVELGRTGHSTLRDIGVSVTDRGVLLEGRVASYYLKQLAQEAVRKVLGPAVIWNKLTVALWDVG